MKSYTVYLHKNKLNGKCYVGITKNKPESRWSNGKGYKGCTAFYGAILKYGWDNFSHEILFTNLSREEASSMEKSLISKYNSRVPYGYNLESGGFNDVAFADETRKRISLKNKGRHLSEEQIQIMREKNLGEKNPNYGKKASEITRKKQSEAHKGKVNSWLHATVGKFDFDGNLIETFPSIQDASEKMNVCITAISNCANGRSKSSCGFIWKHIQTNQ